MTTIVTPIMKKLTTSYNIVKSHFLVPMEIATIKLISKARKVMMAANNPIFPISLATPSSFYYNGVGSLSLYKIIFNFPYLVY
jgi:hypothetical protein